MRAMRTIALVGLLALSACNNQGGTKQEGKATSWNNGSTVSADGSALKILCLDGEWLVGVKTIERLVPPEADSQWVNRDVTFQFDALPEQRTKGTLNESRLELTQADEGSTVSLNYGQDIAAGLIRGNHKTLTLKTKDGGGRPKEWRFDVSGSREGIPSGEFDSLPCPRPAAALAKA